MFTMNYIPINRNSVIAVIFGLTLLATPAIATYLDPDLTPPKSWVKLAPQTGANIDFSKHYQNYSRAEYKLALDGFLEFANKFPTDPLVIQAHFLAAKIYFNVERYDLSLKELKHLLKNYDRADQTVNMVMPSVINLLALNHENLHQLDASRYYLSKLLELYPQSFEAQSLKLQLTK